MALGFDSTIRNAIVDAITTRAGASAKLRIYSGTRPATGGTATTLLVEIVLNATFAPSASSGVLTLNAATGSGTAVASGTATWFRIVKSDGTTFVMDGSAGTSGTDLILDNATIASGATVTLGTPRTFTAGNA